MFWRKRLKKYKEGDEKELQNEIEKGGGLEKGDLTAMIIAALKTFVPICLLILVGLSLLTMLLMNML